MITVCTGCQARYRLEAAKVPTRKIRVRCPACASVFELDGAQRGAPVAPPQEQVATGPRYSPEGDLVLEPAAARVDRTEPAARTEDPPPVVEPPTAWVEAPEPDPTPAHAPTRAPAPAPAPAPATTPTATATVEDEEPRAGRRRRRDKTEMLARALVSDILVYNQAARDKALADGNLLEVLGPEIKKSWELYKEKVGPDAATATTYFKDALNEILADGRHIF